MVVYLVPAAIDNVLRFYETRAEADQSFTVDNINPGKYFVVAGPVIEIDFDAAKSIRLHPSLRSTISREAIATKKEVSFKPCERVADYELPYSP